jgi:hypothetical protein
MSAPYTWIEIAVSRPAAVTAWMSPAGGISVSTWPRGASTEPAGRRAGPVAASTMVALLALDAAVDADDAPGDVVVDRCRLAGQPHERDDGESPARRDVQEVLAVGLGAGGAVGGREPAVGFDEPAQVAGDRVRVLDARVGGADEGREGRVAGEGRGGR